MFCIGLVIWRNLHLRPQLPQPKAAGELYGCPPQISHLQMQPVETPHDREVGVRHRPWQVVDAAAADAQNLRLLGDRQLVVTVDHRFALSNPALVSAPSKKLISALPAPCGIETHCR